LETDKAKMGKKKPIFGGNWPSRGKKGKIRRKGEKKTNKIDGGRGPEMKRAAKSKLKDPDRKICYRETESVDLGGKKNEKKKRPSS